MRLDAVVDRVRMTWRTQAACIDMPVEIFFPTPGPQLYKHVKLALKVCHACPVRSDCLEYALSFDDLALPGIYGGTTERERRRIHHDRQRSATVPLNR